MKVSRKKLLGVVAGAGMAFGIARFPGDAAEFTLKLGNDQPLANPMTANTIAAAAKIKDLTGGRVEINVFPQSALGDDTSMITQVRSGAMELLQIGNNIFSSVLPAAALQSIPFAFASQPQLMQASNGELGKYIANIASTKLGLYKFGATWYGGAFQMQNNVKPIVTPADLKGMKIRVPPGPIDVLTFKAFGAQATPLPISEVYVALQTKLVDGMEIPLPSVQNFKLFEVTKYVSLTSHDFIVYYTVANGASWAKLPKNLQDIIERELNAAINTASTQYVQTEATIEEKLKSEGLVFNRPAIEPFRALIRGTGLYAQWKDQFDPTAWAILEKTVGKLV